MEKVKLPCSRATVDSSELISWRIPTYRISDLEIKEIFAPMNSVMVEDGRKRREEGGWR
jgi:hypothetical protein